MATIIFFSGLLTGLATGWLNLTFFTFAIIKK